MPASVMGTKQKEILQTHLKELSEIEGEVKKAIDAKVPRMEPIIEKIEELRSQINGLIATYFPGRNRR